MSGVTSVPTISFTANGFVVPAQADIVAGLGADWNAAFGGNLNLAPGTPQGQLIASQAAIVGDSDNQQVQLYNGIDPAFAFGRMQDAIGRIYFLTRNAAQPTALQVACGGGGGVVIPVGALVADISGNVYSCTEQGTIDPVSGTVTLGFANLATGAIAAPETVRIYRAIPSWNTATVVSGVVGNAVETRAEFEARREATVAANAQAIPDAVQGAVLKVANVLSAYVVDNPLGTTSVVGGVTLNANSLYVAVYGGAAADVAQAIWTKKNPGCNYNGGTTIDVQDQNPAYNGAGPIYPVSFQTAAGVATCFNVTLKNSSAVPSNVTALVQNAVQSGFTGADGGTRAGIGSTVFASRYYTDVASLGSWANIISIQVGANGTPDASFTGVLAGNSLTVSSVSGTVAIGQFVYGASVASGTIITGGSGTAWTVGLTQTVGSEAMTAATADNNSVAYTIAQMPVLANADINVILV